MYNNNNNNWWNTNLPPSSHTATCPPYLEYALENAKDRAILSTPDAAYRPQTWADARAIVHTKQLQNFQRRPSDLRRYRRFCARVAHEYGSVVEFVLRERLGWWRGDDLVPRGGRPFEVDDDHRILPNDWPYGLAPGIVHLVVWTKFALPTDPTTNELEPATQRLVQDFVDRTFVRVCGADRVVWFLNGPELKSVLAVEHFHVLLLEPDVEWVTGLVGGVVAVGVVEAEADEAEGRDGDGDAPIGYT